MSRDLPTGVVTFLFTDIEGSTRILSRVGSERYTELLERHHELVRAGLRARNGFEMQTEGDAFFAVFTSAAEATDAAVAIQRSLAADQGLAAEGMTVRMGLHEGEGILGGDNYTGIDVHIAARISGSAHGGQILVSDRLADAGLSADASFKPLGEFWLKDIDAPVGISQVLAIGLNPDVPLPRAPSIHPVNAPVDLSSFVGRDLDIERGSDGLRDSRLVTLTGPGGTGKTRLSIEIGSKLSRDFSDGAFFVPLAGIDDPESVPNVVIDALGVPMSDPSQRPIGVLRAYLQQRSILIIMDNFEHVLEAIPSVAAMLEASPMTRVLATSRTPLGIPGEREIAIDPLDIEVSGVQLFAERATSARASFVVDDSNRATVEAIVARLDGLPLAIELAAARIKMMSCEAILETLDPLSLSGRGSTDGEVTLADTIRWSYDLLSEAEQALLTRLGVFPTGAGLAQIEAVARPSDDLGIDVFTGLGALVDHSLLVGQHDGPEPRFRMLETVREFARRRLAESPDEREIHRRHASAYMELVEEARPHLDGADSAKWMSRLGAENANLQNALSFAIESGDADTAQRIVSAAWRFWQSRGHLAEGSAAASAALALEGSSAMVRAEALDAAGSIAYWVGDAEATRRYYDQAVAVRREHGITSGLATALYNLSFPVLDQDGIEAATAVLNETIEAAKAEGSDRYQAMSLIAIARTWLVEDPALALEYAEKGVEATTHLGDPSSAAWSLAIRSAANHHLGEHTASALDLQSSLRVFANLNDLSGIAVTLTGIAENARRLGDSTLALYFVGAVAALRESSGIGIQTALDDTVREYSDGEALDSLSEELRASYDEGVSDPLAAAIERALGYAPSEARD